VLKQWMIDHHYDPEHGLDQPLDAPVEAPGPSR
jgi:hypothetical protein